jgi:neutrophil factor 2
MTPGEQFIVWQNALSFFECRQFMKAHNEFMKISKFGAKLLYNIAILNINMGNIDDALLYFKNAINQDEYFALAYFQIGILQFNVQDYAAAIDSFLKCFQILSGRVSIDYTQLGLEFKLTVLKVCFNIALSYLATDNVDGAGYYLLIADPFKDEENSFDMVQILDDFGKKSDFFNVYLLYTVPNNQLFKPSLSKLKSSSHSPYFCLPFALNYSDENFSSRDTLKDYSLDFPTLIGKYGEKN